jgi:glycosyltransferase involved in cell wall biosynthesis
MSSSPLVTIGVPVYNGEKYLGECLESIARQTYDNWECYVINNRSTDNSLAIAEKIASKESRIKVITNEEFVPMTTNFNNTFKPVSGNTKYFKVVCADDWIFPDFVERMVEVMEKYPNAGICSAYRIDNKEVNCFGLDYYKGNVFEGKEVLHHQLSGNPDVLGSETTVMYRVETLKKIKGYPTIFSYNDYHHDTTLAYELLNISDLCFVFQVLSYTRRHEATFTSAYVGKHYTNLNMRVQELKKYLHLFPDLNLYYKKTRTLYGAFLLMSKFKGDKKTIEWHEKWLASDQKFTFAEQLVCFIKYQFGRITNKFRRDI